MQDLTTGSVARHLLKTTSFMLVAMIFQTLYFLVDLYWVGSLGKEAVAGVAVSGNLTFIVLAVSQMLGVGATTLISHATGRGDRDQARLVFTQGQVLAMVVGVVFTAVAMALRIPYAEGLTADEATAREAASYLLWFLPAMGLQFPMAVMAAALRGTGNFKPGMIVQTATVVINMVVAPILIFGWGINYSMGVAGAAFATLLAVVIGTVWLGTYFLPKESYLRFDMTQWRPRFDLWRRMLSIGLPAGGEFVLMAAYLMIVYVIARPFGAAAQAGFGIGMRIIQAGFMPVVALAFAVAPVAGQNFGARKPDRVKDTFKAALLMSVSAMILLALLCHIAPAAMVRIFSHDPEVVAIGGEYLRIVSWNFVASAIAFVGSSMFQAMGNTLPPLAASFMRLLIIAIPGFIMARMPGFELRWLWYLSVAAVTLQALLNLWLLRREFRVRLMPMTAAATPAAAPAAS
jgi:putative MATE family efflux protein